MAIEIPTTYLINVLIIIEIYAILAFSLNLLAGYAGLLSVAHAALFGVGAYVAGLVALRVSPELLLLLISAVVVTALLALAIAVPTLRLGGDYFILATLGFQVIITDILRNWVDLTRGPFGLTGIPRARLFGFPLASTELTLLLVTACAVGLFLLSWRLVRAPFGRVLLALREDELATQLLGKDLVRFKVSIFVLSGAMAAIAGVLYAHFVRSLTPDSFPLAQSFLLLVIVFVGGGGSLLGSVLGTFLLLLLPEIMRFIGLPSATAGPIQQIIYGLVLVLLMIFRPQGLLGRASTS
ncbi:MAG TPA: branched-chain amino acid ABC transporter permease [Chloroflexota bacterium]|nr:branched-chain amino acid ABC transporter permease [Chloroflexota bacterium]